MASNEITTPESVPPREGEDTNTIASTTALVGVAGITDTIPNEDTSKPQNAHPSPSPNPDSQPPISPEDSPKEKEAPTPESTSTDAQAPTPQLNVQVPQTPQTYITFLFLSGRRRLMNFEPNTTIGRVKELVWAAWTAAPNDTQQPGQEIEERPPAPSYLRVLHLGRMLQDDETLRDLKLPTHLPTSVSSPDTPGGRRMAMHPSRQSCTFPSGHSLPQEKLTLGRKPGVRLAGGPIGQAILVLQTQGITPTQGVVGVSSVSDLDALPKAMEYPYVSSEA
ncbi:hypothetical protein NMY22_g9191 [Coprinellus aureogranulatus]|nr:hypothetical protein NMY22_g9191 [Coprinellus aureogranulatus]